MKRILNYPGSKWNSADIIIGQMPKHETYVEPFFGSGAVFFNKDKSKVETINDMDCRIVNFFRVCRDYPDQLVDKVLMTPHSRQEYYNSYQVSKDPIEDARRFMVRCWQAIGAKTSDRTGWRSIINPNGPDTSGDWAKVWSRVEEVAYRLKGVQIENQDALKLLDRYNRPDVLTYVDPPYLLETRSKRLYQHEYSISDHEELLDLLTKFKGNVILSGYESKMYEKALIDWNKISFGVQAETGAKRTEVLWMNYDPPGQLSLL
ncbi:DNA adenine methylase [Enterococcus wangshanyuanii]|uniref:DNA methyltransferase n=1 Tax=Enterococcus wangshanyuanii TaxID=2005703 RepID=A0ABQ1NSK2_9ENTE|nr:DNA adenine methylase [Enterococcus wangshanyuanii]GGC84403.1 DNA methyltransferase [Enterococcus wangshanyuanii]